VLIEKKVEMGQKFSGMAVLSGHCTVSVQRCCTAGNLGTASWPLAGINPAPEVGLEAGGQAHKRGLLFAGRML